MEEKQTRYIDNQIHGGAIVSTNVQAVFNAVRSNLPGQIEVLCLLRSIPKDDRAKINTQISEIQKRYKIKTVAIKRAIQHAYLASEQNRLYGLLLEAKQDESLEVAEEVVTFLNSIGQWWSKQNTTEKGYLSLYELGEAETSDE